MPPALLGVSVAQISLLINTQIASHRGSAPYLARTTPARLMEFPTALLGVALGAVLMPQLAAAQGRNDADSYSGLLDWGLRLTLVLALPCTVGLLVFPAGHWSRRCSSTAPSTRWPSPRPRSRCRATAPGCSAWSA